MAGLLIKAVPKRVIDFSGFTAGQTGSYVLLQHLDVSQYIDCILLVRVHSATMSGSNGINFDIYGDGVTEDDPGLTFQTSAPLFSSTAVTSTPVPVVITYGGTIRGHFATLIANMNKPSAGSCSATVSIDITLRTPDDT